VRASKGVKREVSSLNKGKRKKKKPKGGWYEKNLAVSPLGGEDFPPSWGGKGKKIVKTSGFSGRRGGRERGD